MSQNARRARRCNRHLCPRGRKALFYSVARGHYRWRPDHPLCTGCWRAETDRYRQVRRPLHRSVRLPNLRRFSS